MAETITKKDLAQAVAKETGIKQTTALEMADSLFNIMREQLIEGNRIEVRGFGVLETKATKPKPAARNPRTGEVVRGFGVLETKATKPKPAARNPRTGEVVYVPARRKTHFRPGKELKSALCEPQLES